MSAVVSETKRYDLTPGEAEQTTGGIVFVDSTVEDYQSLMAGVIAGTEVVILDSEQDGVEQISKVLAGCRGVSSLHIVSHGRPGSVQLGTGQLSLDTLANYASQLQSWAKALADEADILLYGCEVAAGQQGAAFIHCLRQLTGKAIAASTHKTGSTALGGDWELVATSGKIKAPLAFQPEVMAAYGFVLNTTRVSVNSSGTQGNDFSINPSISADGRYVAFESDADNLVPGDTNGTRDIFIYDRQTGNTTRVSVSSSGTQGNSFSFNPSISADGRYVAFPSEANNLVSGDTNDEADIFVYDRQTGNTTRVSVNFRGAQGNDDSINPSISADGRYVTFESEADSLIPDDTNGENDRGDGADIFVYDRQTGNTTRVSVSSSGTQGNSFSINPSISADGRYVTFESDADNLVSDDTNGENDIFVYDRQTGNTTLVSVSSDGTQASGNSRLASISADGRYVTFESNADNLVSDDTNDEADIFVYDRQTRSTTLVSASSDGTQGNNNSRFPSISADGRYVTFESNADNLVSGDTNDEADIFVYDRQTGNTTRVSVSSDGTQASGNSRFPSISADGRYVTFESNADNLVNGDTNDENDIFVHDRGAVVEGNADFNSDGQTDILWRNETTGENVIWLMEGTTREQAVFTTPLANLDWSIGGAGDFNSDGQTDILWRDQVTGQNAIWLMEGTTREQAVFTNPVTDLSWQIGA